MILYLRCVNNIAYVILYISVKLQIFKDLLYESFLSGNKQKNNVEIVGDFITIFSQVLNLIANLKSGLHCPSYCFDTIDNKIQFAFEEFLPNSKAANSTKIFKINYSFCIFNMITKLSNSLCPCTNGVSLLHRIASVASLSKPQTMY